MSRSRRARIMVNQGWGEHLNSVVLVSNMSHEAIHMHGVVVSLRRQEGQKLRTFLRDTGDADNWRRRKDPETVLRQGPLSPGEFMNLGTFRGLVDEAMNNLGYPDVDNGVIESLDVDSIKVTVICNYGPNGRFIGAQRRFDVAARDPVRLRPATVESRTLWGRKAARKLERWLDAEFVHVKPGTSASG
ncbi:hypothetical protein V5738_00735 [Salinisphaera sp. SPP-AMP-43]|uniref:hypothetical protein n=1 Tax=Salinisphaera sp. SPP-AMP-43 TaxID=3121288 RepID=UPI003C6E478E